MGILSNLFNTEQRNVSSITIKEERSTSNYDGGAFNLNNYTSYNSNLSTRLSTVFAATEIISNAVAVLPINIFSTDSNNYKTDLSTHPAAYLLNKQPSKNYSKFSFFKQIIESVILNGNGYAIIIRDKKGKPIEIKYLNPNRVVVNYDYKTDNILYNVVGYDKPIESINMLHFYLHANEFFQGISIISYAINTLKSASDSEASASNFFKSGGAIKGFLTTNNGIALSKDNKEKAKASWDQSFDSAEAGSIPILPPNIEYKPVTISPKDSLLLESRKFSVIEICRFFNISPTKVYDLSNSSYSSLEMTQLQFLEDTINPYLVMITSEINRKIFLPSERQFLSVEFDTTSMLATDKQAIATYYSTLFQTGVLTINEIRKKLNYNKIEFGDDNFLQLNISTVKNISEGTVTEAQNVIQQKVKDK